MPHNHTQPTPQIKFPWTAAGVLAKFHLTQGLNLYTVVNNNGNSTTSRWRPWLCRHYSSVHRCMKPVQMIWLQLPTSLFQINFPAAETVWENEVWPEPDHYHSFSAVFMSRIHSFALYLYVLLRETSVSLADWLPVHLHVSYCACVQKKIAACCGQTRLHENAESEPEQWMCNFTQVMEGWKQPNVIVFSLSPWKY